MARGEQLIRQHRILQILEGSRFGLTLREIRDELVENLGLANLSQRTVRRDIEALQAAGMDIDTHQIQRGTVWKLGPGMRKVPEISLSVSELLALSLARDMLTPLTGTLYWQGIETLWNKVSDALPEPARKHFDRARKHLVVRGSLVKSYANKKGLLDTLNRAILQHRVVGIEYRSSGQKTPICREIEPHAVAVYRGSLYVVAAACEAAPDAPLRHFKLDRIGKATALDRRFTPRGDFDADEHFAHSLGVYRRGEPAAVEVRLSGKVAAWVEEQPWHPDQKVLHRNDGQIVLHIPSVYANEIVPRVLALGPEAEIVSPDGCRNRVIDLLNQAAARYGQANGDR